MIQQITIAYPTQSALMDQRTSLVAATTFGDGVGLRLEFDQQGVVGRGATGDDCVAWPELGKINRMHGGSREWGLVRLATANLPTSLTVNPLFPQTTRRTAGIAIARSYSCTITEALPDMTDEFLRKLLERNEMMQLPKRL